jgi:regulator of protease activity HflC (stomatin/prohibitin superfamily)
MIYVSFLILFITLCLFIISFFVVDDNKTRSILRKIGGVFSLVTIMCLTLASMTTVSPGTVGVPVLFGSTQSYTLAEGFHFVNPFVSIYTLNTRTQTYEMGGGQTAESPGEDLPGNRADDAVNVLTRDQLAVIMEVSIQFHLNAPSGPAVFRSFGEHYADSIVHPIVRAAVRDAASEFTAVALVDQRSRLQERMEGLVRERLLEILGGRHIEETAIIIDNILLRNIDLPTSLDEAIANVQRQLQETAAQHQALETAREVASRASVQAEGEARALTISSTAEAEANRTISASLTPALLRMRAIEATQAITTNPSTRTVILGGGGDMPLILNMDSDPGPTPIAH